ncbi:hypothetical protein B0T16DRAFT_450405 [Cercophora newfieldiana]|uniref:DUF7730 domain-containing protein n=1 Tax=Cercophora newfieldiana TaxID=92897 RepID=A0AA39XVH1_9PEZI|nr:hypothetical protein B0T16DRAFT_450405 [Cercophora newfieldiana]
MMAVGILLPPQMALPMPTKSMALSIPTTTHFTPTQQPAPPKKTGFLDLPWEIRTMIYSHYLPSTRTTPIDRLAKDLTKSQLCQNRNQRTQWSRINTRYHHIRNLLLVSRQVYYEVLGELLDRYRISIPNIFTLKSNSTPARQLEAVFTDLVRRKGQTIRHLEVDVNPSHIVPATSRSVVTTTKAPSGDLSASIADLDLNRDVWDVLLPGLASLKINASPARLSEEWASKILAILQYVDARVTDRCVVEVHASVKQDRTLIEQAMRHPRLKVVVQAEEEEEWWELHGSPD